MKTPRSRTRKRTLYSIMMSLLMIIILKACGFGKKGDLPNIVYILTDDMGYGDVSALNENAAWQTVHMDKLASQGMVFTDAHAESAVCTPTRYGILTGRYSWRTRLKNGVLWGTSKPLIEPDRMTVASLLKANGYRTACIGKWHLGLGWQYAQENPDSVDFSLLLTDVPVNHGFDYSYIIPASLDIPPYVYIENDRSTSIPQQYTVSKTKYGWWRKGLTGTDFTHEQVLPHLTEQSISFMRKQVKKNPDQPFFLYFAMPAPHTPILPTKEFQGKSGTTPYGDYVLEVDAMIGKVMDAVRELGIEDNTLFIVTSDNGCSPAADFQALARFGHDPSYIFRGTKADIWEGGHRVPFIARWPRKIKAGSSCEETVCLNDLMATAAAITGDTLPDNAGEDSYNILPLFEGRKSGIVRSGIVHHSISGYFAIREGAWKLEMCPGSGGWSHPTPKEAKKMDLPPVQLYNMNTDLSEKNNVWDQHPDLVQSLEDELKKLILNGRSTPGSPQENNNPDKWPGTGWMGEK